MPINKKEGKVYHGKLGRPGILTRVSGTLQVEQAATFYGALDINDPVDLDATIAGVALDVYNSDTGASSVGISATGRTALQAHGHIALDSDKNLTLDGTTGQNYMKYNSAQSRMEFYIGGNLVFTVDSNGGHNP